MYSIILPGMRFDNKPIQKTTLLAPIFLLLIMLVTINFKLTNEKNRKLFYGLLKI
jgi:hypothetical protein